MKKILIADDSASWRELVRSILDRPDRSILEADNGHTALRHARSWDPDLILLDLDMPDMNGFEVVEALRREPGFAAKPVVALTGFTDTADQARALKAGFTGFLPKPVRPAQLRVEVDRLVR